MSDQGRWFKLHGNCLSDQHLEELELEQFARWVRMGVYLKVHGTNGTVTLARPCNGLKRILRVNTLPELLQTLRSFPNCKVEENDRYIIVTFDNWLRYQGDMSTERVRKWRSDGTNRNKELERAKNRTEQNRSRKERPPVVPRPTPNGFDRFWNAYPKKIGKGACQDWWVRTKPMPTLLQAMLKAIESARVSEQWNRNNGQYIPNPATWLNQHRWEDNPHPEVGKQKSETIRKLEAEIMGGTG
jgi:hypothetical protein